MLDRRTIIKTSAGYTLEICVLRETAVGINLQTAHRLSATRNLSNN